MTQKVGPGHAEEALDALLHCEETLARKRPESLQVFESRKQRSQTPLYVNSFLLSAKISTRDAAVSTAMLSLLMQK